MLRNSNPVGDDRRKAVEEAAEMRLKSSPYPSIQRVNCDFKKGRLTLHGRVSTFFEKQIAQQAVIGLDGVRRLENRIEVR